MRAMPLFDAYLFIDWSARGSLGPRKPCADALWIGERGAGAESGRETYWRGREECCAYLRRRLEGHARAGRRVLAGFDFPFAYPAGWADALGLEGGAPPWRRVWDELGRVVRDGADNANNRFAAAAELNARCGAARPGPLWGCPRDRETESLSRRGAGFPFPARDGRALGRLRLTDRRLRGLQEAWKLYGTGSAGGQALVGIPRLDALRRALGEAARLWPFETGFAAASLPAPGVLLAEVWPGIVRDRLDPEEAIRDRAQVRALARWAEDADGGGRLAALLGPPPGLSAEEIALCEREEGWILGAA